MLNRDDIARAARYTDALSEEIGFEGVLKRYGVDKDGLLYMQEQRALRHALIYEGRNPANLPQDKPVAIQLTSASRRLMPMFGASWVDGFITGLRAQHDPSFDLPDIASQ